MGMVELDRSLERGILALWLAVWRSKLLFLFVTGVVFALIVVGSLAIQPTYEGSTMLIGGQGSLEPLPDGSRRQAETSASLARIAESEEVVGEAIEKIGLATLVPDPGPPAASRFARLRQLVFPLATQPQVEISTVEAYLPRIKQTLNVRGEPNSDVIRIAFRHRDPVVAAAFANTVAQTFVDRQIALQSRPGAADFFLRQRQRFDEEVRRASDELKGFSAKTGIYAADDQRQLLLRRLNDQEAALALTRGSIAEKAGQRQALSDELRRLAPVSRSPFVSSLVDALGAPTPPRPGDPRVADDPPLLLVRVYQDSMVALFKINSDLSGAQTLQKQQQDEVAHLRVELDRLSQDEQSFVSLKRGVDQATFNSDLYAKRMVQEQINAESNAAKLSSVKVLQKATIPLRPVFPNYRLVILVAALVGGAAGTGAALLKSRPRRM